MEQVNSWSQVVALLSRLSSGGDITGGESWRAACRRGARTGRIGKWGNALEAMPVAVPHNRITAIERQSDACVLISWCDPTMCHYVDQVWGRVTASYSGHCALTGQRIQRGDQVFRPRWRGRLRPANCDEMILATALAKAD
ncbi:hypothetical protein AWB69_07131 [Caballeronia udeis]|uniref:DUF3331 domain-containing protein n=1 Tax=Caballeronia udeis TaxID=1232866 RepID=A0A158J5C5_9BURK|nr:DUF3331 domain-containing protein [Caballeronia udeis]SAL63531.1 hypothetical protein AWB69_07131 [Caballeronia udeis]